MNDPIGTDLETRTDRVERAPPVPRGIEQVGVVVIGRNEGARLVRCFDSLPPDSSRVVYVDSGSSDDSVAEARRRGIEVVELDMSVPFTAARARNSGVERLLRLHPAIPFVQFVDGDCELRPGWIADAVQAMGADPGVAVVSGGLRERARSRSVYNLLCDLEWDTPVGEVSSCGGIALMRTAAFQEVGGFDARVSAGEEPELCLRLRRTGHRILRIPAEMATHDAAITRFGQWWRRMVRSGYGYAGLEAMHPGMWRRELRSIITWALVLPLIVVACAWPTRGLGLGFLLLYPALWLRIFIRRRRSCSGHDAALYASFCVLGKFAELVGIAHHWARRRKGLGPRLLEYK